MASSNYVPNLPPDQRTWASERPQSVAPLSEGLANMSTADYAQSYTADEIQRLISQTAFPNTPTRTNIKSEQASIINTLLSRGIKEPPEIKKILIKLYTSVPSNGTIDETWEFNPFPQGADGISNEFYTPPRSTEEDYNSDNDGPPPAQPGFLARLKNRLTGRKGGKNKNRRSRRKGKKSRRRSKK